MHHTGSCRLAEHATHHGKPGVHAVGLLDGRGVGYIVNLFHWSRLLLHARADRDQYVVSPPPQQGQTSTMPSFFWQQKDYKLMPPQFTTLGAADWQSMHRKFVRD